MRINGIEHGAMMSDVWGSDGVSVATAISHDTVSDSYTPSVKLPGFVDPEHKKLTNDIHTESETSETDPPSHVSPGRLSHKETFTRSSAKQRHLPAPPKLRSMTKETFMKYKNPEDYPVHVIQNAGPHWDSSFPPPHHGFPAASWDPQVQQWRSWWPQSPMLVPPHAYLNTHTVPWICLVILSLLFGIVLGILLKHFHVL